MNYLISIFLLIVLIINALLAVYFMLDSKIFLGLFLAISFITQWSAYVHIGQLYIVVSKLNRNMKS